MLLLLPPSVYKSVSKAQGKTFPSNNLISCFAHEFLDVTSLCPTRKGRRIDPISYLRNLMARVRVSPTCTLNLRSAAQSTLTELVTGNPRGRIGAFP